jgi:hypothetical protein
VHVGINTLCRQPVCCLRLRSHGAHFSSLVIARFMATLIGPRNKTSARSSRTKMSRSSSSMSSLDGPCKLEGRRESTQRAHSSLSHLTKPPSGCGSQAYVSVLMNLSLRCSRVQLWPTNMARIIDDAAAMSSLSNAIGPIARQGSSALAPRKTSACAEQGTSLRVSRVGRTYAAASAMSEPKCSIDATVN